MSQKKPDISVIISTYNRCELLKGALESLLQQDTGVVRYEILVVDNNSTDETRAVVESFMLPDVTNLRYVFESQQGISYARNTGIAHSAAPIIAFTDDDVRVQVDWIYKIKQTFDQHPEADFIGGKVLPLFNNGTPPNWLTIAHWSPLALVDYGEKGLAFNSANAKCLIGANLAVRREVFEKVGMFATDFQRVKDGIGSTEDHEWQLRSLEAGGVGWYVPELVIYADVQANRLDKEYHRRWHMGHGGYCALMRISDYEQTSRRLFDVPAHLYRQTLESFVGWLKAALRGDETAAFNHETRLRFFQGFFRARVRDYRDAKKTSANIKAEA